MLIRWKTLKGKKKENIKTEKFNYILKDENY